MEEFEKISEKMKEGILYAETLAEILDDVRSRLEMEHIEKQEAYAEIDRLKEKVQMLTNTLIHDTPSNWVATMATED